MLKILFFLFSTFIFAQEKITSQYIDSKLKRLSTLGLNGKHDQYIRENMLVLKEAKKISYSKGITLIYLNLSNTFIFEANYKKSLKYLNLAKTENYAKNDLCTQMKIKQLTSYNYIAIGLYKDAIIELKEIAVLSDKIPVDSIKIYTKASAFIDTGVVYRGKKQFDSATFYLEKAIALLQKKKNQRLQTISAWAHLTLIEVKIDENKIDSADIYFKLLKVQKRILVGSCNVKLYQVKGKIYDRKKKYSLAINNYQKALELAKETKNIHVMSDLYQLISQAYLKINNKELYKTFLQKYNSTNNSLNTSSQDSTESIVKELVIKKEEKLKSKTRSLIYIICIIAILVIAFFIYIFTKIRKERKILNKKNQETKLLNKKLNTDFEEIVRLAKNNDSEFLNRFQEVYPDLFPGLLEIEPNMLINELRFCALLFLNFSTKDIAQYTLVQPQSIQIRKHRLRKKLGIPSNVDIYIWMKNVNQNNKTADSTIQHKLYSYSKYNCIIKKLSTLIKR
ncbi:tetratricopeptide repeat protein [Chryseobacterium paludis]|uniref:tetratricopeptide repeat protein n=1 Tax=Chryseobacterium paludis TaxID=2956784 RepID=UPI0021BF7ABB|nr:hypothetical protein [Chryseobacterium paludis]